MTTHEAAATESVEQLAKRTFAELHQSIVAQEAGSLAGEVEAVHAMRVAIRRLRVALSNFAVCAPKEDRKRLREQLENLAGALGGVRDLDVMIAALKSQLLNRSGEEKAAISALIRRLRDRRRLRLRALVNYLRGEEYAGFKHKFSSEPASAGSPEPVPEPLEIPYSVIEEEHGQAA
jgi:CHAD domain-containing protein